MRVERFNRLDEASVSAQLAYEAHLGKASGRVRLKYTTTRLDGEQRESDYWIQLETTPQPFGGRRWWFVCPRTGRRAAKLYLPNGALVQVDRRQLVPSRRLAGAVADRAAQQSCGPPRRFGASRR
jgi:hypothetical protein